MKVGVGNAPGDLLLDALMHRSDPDRRAHGRADDAMQAHSGREDRSDRLRVGDQRFVFERQLGLGDGSVGHRESGQVPPVADLAPPCSVTPPP